MKIYLNLKRIINLKKVKAIKGEVTYSDGIYFDLFENQKLIKINQTKPNDWIMIKNSNLKDWDIQFYGIASKKMPYLKKERVNKYGLTGCLNIYNSNLNKTSIKTINGDCEDSVNISNSKGSVSNIEVINASQDGIDIDYSNLNISNIFVRNAGNDCFDVSAGSYNINAGTFSECNDKGISIGEKSYLTMQNIFINSSNTAISVKDLSKAIIKKQVSQIIKYV